MGEVGRTDRPEDGTMEISLPLAINFPSSTTRTAFDRQYQIDNSCSAAACNVELVSSTFRHTCP
eukprot:15425559-Alexandrium_andersonii.AAC.1